MDSGEYCYLLWGLAVSAPEAAVGHRRPDENKFMDAAGDHQFYHRGGPQGNLPQTAGSIFRR